MVWKLADRKVDVRRAAWEALSRIDATWPTNPATQAAIPALVEKLADESSIVRWRAAETLSRIGPVAQVAITALRRLKGNHESYIRGVAEFALQKIEHPSP